MKAQERARVVSDEGVQPDRKGAAARPARQPAVHLAVTDDGLHVTGPGGAGPDSIYATILLRDGERCAETGYSRATDARFAWPTVDGVYRAVRLERRQGAPEVVRLASRSMRLPSPETFDATPWSPTVRFHASAETVPAENGLHRIHTGGTSTLDLLLDGMDRARPERPLLVCLNASVAGRAHKIAPFFSGLRLAAACGLPLLSVSDPAVASAGRVALGWYAGTADQPELPRSIAAAIDRVAAATGARQVLLAGGSGGGFAALAIHPHLATPGRLLVWNPQTSIAEYHAPSVRAYLHAAFPGLASRLHGRRGIDAAALRQALEASGVAFELRHQALAQRLPSLYLQNRSDALHLQRHLARYLPDGAMDTLARQKRLTLDDMTFCLANWGRGHLPLPQRAIVSMVRGLADGEWPAAAVKALDRLQGPET